MDPDPLRLPPGFRFGASTAAYQIEGAAAVDGRGASIWDTFSHTPGRIADGSSGDVACDHYHRYAEDVGLLASLGVGAYRFSVAWPRVQPDGSGPVNPAGLAFYDRLVDLLLERGIDPVVTLFHWDLPQALAERGGWHARDTAHRFAEYAALTAARLGDRVRLWITLNEPVVHLTYGHALGVHAPGEARLFDALPVAHHQLLAHGLGVAALRAQSGTPVALTNNYSPVRLAGSSAADRAAGQAFDAIQNRLFTDPVLGRGYPAGLPVDLTALRVGGRPLVRDRDLTVIAAPIDVLGVNYYSPTGVRAPADPEGPLPFDMVPLEEYPRTAFDWPVAPDGLHELHTGLREVVQVGSVPVVPHRAGAFLVVTGAGVDQDGPALAAQHPGLQRRDARVRAGVVEVGGQPLLMVHPVLWPAVGEEGLRCQFDRAEEFHDAGDGDVAELYVVHRTRLGPQTPALPAPTVPITDGVRQRDRSRRMMEV